MLPKENRLTDDYDFRRVRRIGRKYRSPFFLATVAPAKDLQGSPRFGFVVSNKIDKRATARNRIKRLLREAVHQRLGEVKRGFDVTIVAHQKMRDVNLPEVRPQIDRFLSEVSLV